MDNLVRADTVFGKRVNIVGNISADLVLESLGKIYIKSRNKSLTLEEVIRSLTGEDPNISTSRVKVVEGIEGLDTTEFKEGTFVFDKLSNILYLFIDGELLELINVAPEGTGYVKRSGDTMTGRLAIYVKNGPPLYVNSSTLVENLNARYLNGETGESFTRRNRDEKINGAWTFRKPITFESSTLFYKDIVTHGSIGTPEFSSGFGGYGWRMDADTNTLTIDNLVVRKLMQVYELVVNRISATNGSLWITNAGKVTSVLKLEIKESSFFADTTEYNKFCLNRHLNEFFIRLFDPIEYKSFTNPVAAFSTASGDGIFVKQCWSNETLRNAKIVKTLLDTSYVGSYFNDTNAENYKIYSLFSDEFVFDCTFPIITRNDYTRYLQEKEEGNVNIASYISVIYSYFKYFAGGDYYIVTFDDDGLPVFKPGDILRCLKWTYGGIKYYDAVVCNIIGKLFIILLAGSILDKKTTITYDSSLNAQVTYGEDEVNLGLYQQSSHYKEPSKDPNKNINYDENGNVVRLSYLSQQEKDLIGLVEEKDSLVLMGNLWDPQRQNAVYITSTDNGAPFMDVISGVNRPDYSVIYYVPIYLTVKLHTTASVNKNTFVGFTHLVDIPYTGDYYILKDGTKCEYVYFKYNDVYYLASGSTVPNIPGGSVDIIYYLSTIPNENTEFGSASEFFFFLTEDGEKVITEGFEGGGTVEEEYIILEEEHPLLLVASTRTTKARLGNLNGIQDEIFPMDRLPYGYGLYGLNVFLTGEFYLNNGRSLADIGNDAITFAVAALNALYNSLDVLREDLLKADELLSLSVYSKGELRSAGMRIANNNILLWGNHIIIATTENEFKGIEEPTALFAEGKIQAKFIVVNDIHSREIGINTPYIYKYGDITLYKFSGYVLIGNDLYEYQTYYYTTDPTVPYEVNGERIKDADVIAEPLFYRWHLKEDGSGYLGSGNLSWDKDGNLDFKGNIYILNGSIILCIDNNNNAGLSISSNYYDTTDSWLNNIKYRLLYVNNKETDSVIYNSTINSLSVTLTSLSLHISGSARGAQATIDISVVYSDSTSETINWNASSNNTITISNGTLISSISLTYTGPGYLSGTIKISSDIVSEIGCNFIGIYPKNNSNSINKNLFWVGGDKIYMGSSNYSLELKDNGIFLLLKEWNSGNDAIDYYNSSPINEINLMSLIPQNKVKIINFDSNRDQTLNIDNSSPKIFLIQLPENNPLANKTIKLNSSEVANGTIIIISHGLGFTDGLADYNIKIKTNENDVEPNKGLFIPWNKHGELESTSEIQLINEPIVLMALSKEVTNNLITFKYVYWKSLSSKY